MSTCTSADKGSFENTWLDVMLEQRVCSPGVQSHESTVPQRKLIMGGSEADRMQLIGECIFHLLRQNKDFFFFSPRLSGEHDVNSALFVFSCTD